MGSDYAYYLKNTLFFRLLRQVQGTKRALLYTQFTQGVSTGTFATAPVDHLYTAIFYLKHRRPSFTSVNHPLRDSGGAGFLTYYITNAASGALFLVYYEFSPFQPLSFPKGLIQYLQRRAKFFFQQPGTIRRFLLVSYKIKGKSIARRFAAKLAVGLGQQFVYLDWTDTTAFRQLCPPATLKSE